MAFTIQSWCRASASANEPLDAANVRGCFREYSYFTADAHATVLASGYFDTVAYDITTGDYVNVYSSTDLSELRLRLTNTSGVITSSLEPGQTRKVVTTISNAQLLALSVTPITVMAAPGASLMYLNVRAAIKYNYSAAVTAAGGALGIQYGATAALAGQKCTGTASAASINALAADSTFSLAPASVNPAAATVENVALSISNDTANFTNAGGAATLTVHVMADLASFI
jgi:hypothetical protein